MRKFFLILCAFVLVHPVWALDVDYRFGLGAGWIMPDGKVDVMVGQENQWYGPVIGADFSATFYPSWNAFQQWNGAGWGVGLAYWNLSDSLLGHAIAPYTYMDIPLVKLLHFRMGLRPGIGAALMTKTYPNTVSEENRYQSLTDANRSIGSMLNLYFPEMLYLDFPLAKGWTLGVNAGWYHISNGSVRQPNSGYNIFAGELCLRYRPAHRECMCDLSLSPSSEPTSYLGANRWHIAVAATGGARQVYYRDQQSFLVGSAHVAAYWLLHPIFRLGLGVDAFYDAAYKPRDTYFQKTYLAAADPNGADCWRVGVSLQPEFVVGDFTAGLHVGAYMYDPVKNLEPYAEAKESESGRLDKPVLYKYDFLKAGSAGYVDGWLYTELVLRYHLPWHVFIQAMMKSHLTKVEFISLGLGFYY